MRLLEPPYSRGAPLRAGVGMRILRAKPQVSCQGSVRAQLGIDLSKEQSDIQMLVGQLARCWAGCHEACGGCGALPAGRVKAVDGVRVEVRVRVRFGFSFTKD